jgi:putative transcriptional regulator
MNIRGMSDGAIGQVIGNRLQELRLQRNMSYLELCRETGVSRQTLHALLHEGKGTLATVIAVIRALGDLESLGPLLEAMPLSPIQLLKLKGVARKRATGTRKPSQKTKPKPKELDW